MQSSDAFKLATSHLSLLNPSSPALWVGTPGWGFSETTFLSASPPTPRKWHCMGPWTYCLSLFSTLPIIGGHQVLYAKFLQVYILLFARRVGVFCLLVSWTVCVYKSLDLGPVLCHAPTRSVLLFPFTLPLSSL